MGQEYVLNLSYDEKTDEYFAFVDDGTRKGKVIFQIDNTEELCDYIKTGKMSHMDDADGLSSFLKEQGFLEPDDKITLNPELLF